MLESTDAAPAAYAAELLADLAALGAQPEHLLDRPIDVAADDRLVRSDAQESSRADPGQERGRLPASDSARRGAANQVRAERLAFKRKRAWTMNTAPTAMTSQSQTLKPSSTPSATVRAMIKVKAATVAQFLTRECDLATPSFPSVDPLEGCYSPPSDAGATTVVAREARRPTQNRSEPSRAHLGDVTLRRRPGVHDQVVDSSTSTSPRAEMRDRAPRMRLCPTACPTDPGFPMAKPDARGIIIRVSWVRVPPPASRSPCKVPLWIIGQSTWDLFRCSSGRLADRGPCRAAETPRSRGIGREPSSIDTLPARPVRASARSALGRLHRSR
jgi:hypothetical protein